MGLVPEIEASCEAIARLSCDRGIFLETCMRKEWFIMCGIEDGGRCRNEQEELVTSSPGKLRRKVHP